MRAGRSGRSFQPSLQLFSDPVFFYKETDTVDQLIHEVCSDDMLSAQQWDQDCVADEAFGGRYNIAGRADIRNTAVSAQSFYMPERFAAVPRRQIIQLQ